MMPMARLLRPSRGVFRPFTARHPPSARLYSSRHRCRASKAQTPAGLSIARWSGTPAQVQAVEALRRKMASAPYDMPDDETLRWFIMDRSLDVEEAYDKLIAMLRWRREFGADLITVSSVAKEAATGKACLHTHRDKYGRPVILVRASRHVVGQSSPVESQRLCVHLLDRALQQLREEGWPAETVLGVFDLRGFSSRNADLAFVRFLVDVFFIYFPKRLSQVLLVDAPWVFRPGWEMVRPWLKKYAALVRFVSVDEVRREYFTPQTVPDEFKEAPFPPRR